MNVAAKKQIVLLGMMTKMPVPGVVWQYVHYLVGFQRLGYDVYYVEQHARTPSMFMQTEQCDGSTRAATFLNRVMERLNLQHSWSYQALHESEQCFGLSEGRLKQLFASAELIINLHGGTEPRPEHSATGRLVYLETDPVQLQIELYRKRQTTIDFLAHHCAFFTFGENIGKPDCALPTPKQFHFFPTRQPVVIEFWPEKQGAERGAFTTVGNWRQNWRIVKLRGEKYTWSKDVEFFKFLDLPARTSQRFELALAGCTEKDKQVLEQHGWKIREAAELSADIDCYREYIADSQGEFTVAKDQNVRLRSGWFSDRSATYLASGRPVITQETGFSNILPSGCGLFGFSNLDEAVHAFEQVDRDYEKNRRCAREIACEYFDSNLVLEKLLRDTGVSAAQHRLKPFPKSMVLEPVARRPLKLAPATLHAVNSTTIAAVEPGDESVANVSIVMVTFDNLVLNRLSLETLLAHTGDCEVVVVDNASRDGTVDYLKELSALNPRVRPVFNAQNLGFARASNQGIVAARGETLVLLNNDALVSPGWLPRLVHHLEGENVGAVGPVTNRIGNEAQLDVACRSYGDFLDVATNIAATHAGTAFEIPTLTMFCFAMRRKIFDQVGKIDEGFGVGTLEDDDYSLRLKQAGLQLLCAEDVFVYHFGEASFGKLVSDGSYNRLLVENQRRFEKKWSHSWSPYGRRVGAKYHAEREAVRRIVIEAVPAGRIVAIATRGDVELLKIPERPAWHFPRTEGGQFSGHYPGTGSEAVNAVKELSAAGAQYLVFPASGFWWLDYYVELRNYCRTECNLIAEDPEHCMIFALPASSTTTADLPAGEHSCRSLQSCQP